MVTASPIHGIAIGVGDKSVSTEVNRGKAKERQRERERFGLPLIGLVTRQVGPSSGPSEVVESSRVELSPPDTRYTSFINVIIKNTAIRPRQISICIADTHDGPMRNERSAIGRLGARRPVFDARHLSSRLRDENNVGLQRTHLSAGNRDDNNVRRLSICR